MTQLAEPPPDLDERQELHEYIGWHIQYYRIGRGWTRDDLAAEVDRNPVTVATWENATRAISVADLVAVARAFGVPVAALLPRGGQ